MFTKANRFFSVVLLALCSGFAGAQISPAAIAPDVEYIATQLASGDIEAVKEALVILRWSGINDQRIFDPLAAKVESGQVSMKQGLTYVEALGLSGNPAYLGTLESVAANNKRPDALRKAARRAKDTLARSKLVADEMNKGVEQAKTNAELWAIRHRNGLAVQDSVRMRLAARDIFLHKRGPASLDVAADALRSIDQQSLIDLNRMDGYSFLCKALGVSGDRRYMDVLVQVANSTTYDKLADYAERSAQYYDPQFKRTKSAQAAKKKGSRH